MNEQNKNDLIKFWLNVASYYRQNVPDETIKMYAYHCRDFSIEEIRAAFEKHCESGEAKFFPLPVVLKNIIRPPFDEEAEANEVVAKILSCMNPFKSAQTARSQMGELAWSVVQGVGGWAHLGNQPPPDSFVQRDMREMAKAKLVRAQQGRTHELPALPGSNRPQIGGQTNSQAIRGESNVTALITDALKGKELN